MRALTLIVRNLDASAATDAHTRVPALESFLSRCTVSALRQNSVTGWVCAAHGIERHGDWPAGAILASGCAEPAEGTGAVGEAAPYWICAQPVHLAVDRDSLVLQPPSQLHLSGHESRQLFDALKQHFRQEQLIMKYADTGIWCIGTDDHQDLSTTEPELAQGRNVDGLLPRCADANRWQRLIMEAQMILHEHPVNAAREARGDMPVNSLWIWGGGTLAAVESRFDAMCAADPLLRAIARLSDARLIDAPGNLQGPPEADNMLVEFVLQPANVGDASLPVLEAHWLAPAWRGLASGWLDELTLVLPLRDTIAVCRCARKERRRFWRRRQSIPGFLARFAATAARS